MNKHISNDEILASYLEAIKNEQFFIVLQPQYNHSNGLLVGAEALSRWNHPDYGLISPIDFIPVLEENKLTSYLDLFVFEKVCALQRKCVDENYHVIPISVNISRCDIVDSCFVDKLEEIRKKYNISTNLIPLELTESAIVEDISVVQSFIEKIHKIGYKLEMDDFGSGYSSLNVLKDVDFDLIKLDLKFLSGQLENGRGGIIVSSIVKMVSWIGLPIIAEGVETIQQADFMLSVGCEYIQGYLYSKPIAINEFTSMLKSGNVCKILPPLKLIETMNAGSFWSPESLETLIFNSYTGGAAIFEYKNNHTEVLRVNEKFLKELGMNLSEKDLVNSNLFDFLSKEDQKDYVSLLNKVKESQEEQESEHWWTIKSHCCGKEKLCIRSSIRMIGVATGSTLYYLTIRNITAEKNRFNEILTSEKRFKMASEQVNIYYWEYTVATKEMRPCFRCMRDLGLPALVTNYPEPAIEMGIFPPEVADMYRDWHRQIANGVKNLEAVIPLTSGRVPFLVRYTTEFDSVGRPVKAYGSAALVVDKK